MKLLILNSRLHMPNTSAVLATTSWHTAMPRMYFIGRLSNMPLVEMMMIEIRLISADMPTIVNLVIQKGTADIINNTTTKE